MARKLPSPDVLCYRPSTSHRTAKRHYIAWRNQQDPPLPYWCDKPECQHHTPDPLWNGEPLKLTVDHINGVNRDNRAYNLRLLCPNCDSQIPTRGGGAEATLSIDPLVVFPFTVRGG